VECVTGGYQPLPVDGQEQPVQRQSLTCTQMNGNTPTTANTTTTTNNNNKKIIIIIIIIINRFVYRHKVVTSEALTNSLATSCAV